MTTPEPSPAQAAEPSARRTQRRADLEAFIQKELLPGVHFSTIHRKVNQAWCPKRDAPDTWKGCDTCHQRPGLRQSGAERIADYLGYFISEPTLARDIMETVKLTTQLPTVAFRITLADAAGRIAGHGIGANSHEDLNIALKKAKKNALIDAVRTTAAISDLFHDGGEEGGGGEGASPRSAAAPAADGAPRRAGRPGGAPPATTAAPPAAAAPAAPAVAPPPRAAAPAPTVPPPSGAPPSWWKVGVDVPGALWNVTAKDGDTHPCQGAIHFPAEQRALIGPQGREWNFFSPNAQGKPEFKTKPPWTLWAQMTWQQLLEYAVEHRTKHQAAAQETNKFNDPFCAILTDTYAVVYNGIPTPLAEHAAAMDKIAWGILARRREKAGGAPAAPAAAAPPPAPAPPPPAPAPALAPAGRADDGEETPF